MDLLLDVLDQQVIDKHGRKSGKVDGIAIEIREGKPPRVAYLEMGTGVLARRLSPRLERWLQRWRERSGRKPTPFQVPWSKVKKVHLTVDVDVDAAKERGYQVERWLAEHVIGPIPGSEIGHEDKQR
jgi:sporulation protein YlmC with PRC-barrel domain